jgi:hypothetical protein
MSTPISALPMKTQQAGGTGDVNDINDPIVQDVLNEFQEELMISKQPKTSQFPQSMPQMQPQHMPPPIQYPSSQYPPAYPQHNSHMNGVNNNKYENISSYLDTDVAKRSLILVILAVIIYHSGIINSVYEKMPDYLHDNLNMFDIYIKSISLFSIIYVLSFFEYI